MINKIMTNPQHVINMKYFVACQVYVGLYGDQKSMDVLLFYDGLYDW